MKNSTQRKLGAILSYTSIIINSLITILYTPFLLRMLGQEEYGLYSLISSIIGYLTILDLGFGNAIIVFTAKYKEQKKEAETKKLHGMFKVVFNIISIFAIIIGLVLYFNVDNIFGNTMSIEEIEKAKVMMLILVFNLTVTFNFTIYTSIVNAHEKFVFQKLINIISSILKPLLMIPLLFLGYKSISLCLIITIINILVLLSNYYFCKRKLKINVKFCGFDKKIFKTIFSYSIYIFLAEIVTKINWSLDQFILGAVVGTIEISLYAVASQFVTLYRNLSSCCCGVMLPKLSKMVGRNVNDAQLSQEFIKFGRIQWYLMFLILCGLIIYGYDFIKIWAGSEYGKSYIILLILLIPEAMVLVENIGLYIMQAKNMHKPKAIIAFITALLNIVISILLAKSLGAIGTAIGTALALIICNLIIINIYYQKKVKLDVISFWKNILKISIPIIPVFVIALYTNFNIFRATNLVSIILMSIIFSILYFIVAYKFSFNEYEKNLIKNLLIDIKKRSDKNAINNQ